MTIRIRILIMALVFAGVAGATAYVLQREPDPLFGWKYPTDIFPIVTAGSRVTFSRSDAHSEFRNPGGAPLGLPVRLKIPVIGVNSAIEDAVLTSDGKMDMPTGSVNVAWFSLGPPPGVVGSAVIGGHFGVNKGAPFVFEHLNKLKTGDKIYIEDDRGATIAFAVRTTSLYERNADARTVFTSQDGLAHLNLITCEGIWNKVDGAYPQRRVVFTDFVPTDNTVAVQQAPPTPSPVLSQVPSPTFAQKPPEILPDASIPPATSQRVLIVSGITVLLGLGAYAAYQRSRHRLPRLVGSGKARKRP